MLLRDVVETSAYVRKTASRADKIRNLAACLQRSEPEAIGIVVALLSGKPRQGRIGIGPATLEAAMPQRAAPRPVLTVTEVDREFSRLAEMIGPGSRPKRERLLRELLARATPEEQDFLMRVLLGDLRQGALEGIMTEAVAAASGLPIDEIRRALMVHGDLATVARLALTKGRPGLARLAIRPFRPVRPMLAQTARDVADALAQLGKAAFEDKLDGARIQVHKQGVAVRVFTRRLNDVTRAVPEIVEAVCDLPARTLILDGEALAFRPDGRPQPFQVTMRRFGRKDAARLRQSIPLRPFFFDCLYLDDMPFADQPAALRFAALARVLPPTLIIRRIVTDQRAEAEAFFKEALARGHEGVMAKALDAPYEAGARGRAWLKIKQAITLDLVVLAAEWGHGRRAGWLSNLHLGARDTASGRFVMVGKTFKGMTDEMLKWQTARLRRLATAQDASTVYVRPELVVEVAFNDIQASPRYPSGLALRFARVKRYRPDKDPQDADTIDTLRALYEQRFAVSNTATRA